MQPDEMRAALDGAWHTVEAAHTKVGRAAAAWLDAKVAHGPADAPYAAAFDAWQAATDGHGAAMARWVALLLALIPAVVWPTPTEPAHAD